MCLKGPEHSTEPSALELLHSLSLSSTADELPCVSELPFPHLSNRDKTGSSLTEILELTPKKDVLFIIGDWNAKVGSQEITGVTRKFGLGVQNEAGQRQTVFAKRTHWS